MVQDRDDFTFSCSRDIAEPATCKLGHVTLTTPIYGYLSSWGKYLIWPAWIQNLKTVDLAVAEIWRKTQNIKTAVIWVIGVTQGHWQCHHLI